MGKSLLELLDSYQFTKGLDPKTEKAGMIKPDPGSAFDVNIKQSKAWLKATPKIYGADIIRITTQGQVDTKKLKKAAVKGAAQLASKIPIVGGIVGGQISQLINPKLPDDLIENDKVYKSLYTDLLYGKIRNDKGALGNFLKDNAGLKNLGQNLKNALISAAIGGATKLVSAGLDALVNKKKFTLKKKKLPAVKAPVGQLSNDNFPSTFAFQSGITDNIAVNQFQFTRRSGLLGGTFGAGFELGKEQSKIKILKLSQNPTEDGLTKGTSNRLDDYYKTTYKKLENSLITKYSSFKSIDLWDAKDDNNANPFNYEKINGIGYNMYTQTSQSTDNKNYFISLNYGSGDNVLDNLGGISKDGTISYNGTVIARQRFTNEKTFIDASDTDGGVALYKNVNKSTTPYYTGQEKYVPYLTKKDEVLKNNGYDIINLAINGITLLGTITGLSDNATPSWTDVKPVGSGFKFHLYDSWEREISFKFQMYAENKEQLNLIWDKAESIKKLTLPVPKKSLGVFGQLISLEIGNIINVEYGFLSTCNLTVSDDTSWEITAGGQKPMLFEMDITYKVVSNTDNTSYTFYS